MSFWIFTHSKQSNKVRSTKQSKQGKKKTLKEIL